MNDTKTPELNAHQKFMKKLDDKYVAFKFQRQKEQEIKDLIDDILSVTTGNSVVTEMGSEWGHRNLFRIFEIFMIRHENFHRSGLAENLQRYLFHWTIQHDKSLIEWFNKIETNEALEEEIDVPSDDSGRDSGDAESAEDEETEQDAEQSAREADAAAIMESNKRKYVKQLAAQVEMALNSPDTKEEVKDCLKTIIGEISNNADMRLMDFSLVRAALPNIIDNLGDDYATGFMHSISSIIEYETSAFRKFYEKRMDEQPEAADVPEGMVTLATQLSEAMRNPLMPTALYNAMSHELTDIPVETDSPEWILGNLKMQQPPAEHSE